MIRLVLIPLLFVASQAWADVCSSTVFDGARIFKNPAVVEQAAASLKEDGAEVHVVTVKRYNESTMDRYANTVLAGCPSWQSPQNAADPKSNTILVAVGVDQRQMGIYFGSLYRSLKSDTLRIQQTVMKPRFKDGDYDGGIVAALEEINRVTTAALHPPVQDASVGKAVIVQPSQPTDFSGLWTVLMYALFMGCGVGLLLWGVPLISQRQERESKRKAAQLRAKSKVSGCGSAINSYTDQLDVLKLKVNELLKQLKEEDARELNDAYSNARRSLDSTAERFASVSTSTNDPTKHLSTDEYLEIESSFEVISQGFEQIQRDIHNLEKWLAAVDNIKKRTKDLGDDVPKVRSRIEEAKKLFSDLANEHAKASWVSVEGNGSEAEAVLHRIEGGVANLTNELAKTDGKISIKSMLAFVKTLEKDHEHVVSLLNSIAARKKQLDIAKKDASPEIVAAEKDIVSAREYCDAHKDECASRADEIRQAQKNLDAAKKQMDLAPPNFIEALRLASEANKQADEILAMARDEISALERLKREEKSALRDAERAISKAKEFHADRPSYVTEAASVELQTAIKTFESAQQDGNLAGRVSKAKMAYARATEAYNMVYKKYEDKRRQRSSSSSRSRYDRSSYDRGGDVNVVAIGSWGGSDSHRSSGSSSSSDSGYSGGSSSYDSGSSGWGGGSSSFDSGGGGGGFDGGSSGW